MRSIATLPLLLLAGAFVCLAAEPFNYKEYNEVLQFFGPDFPCYMCEQIAELGTQSLCNHLKEAGLESHCQQIARDYALVKASQKPKDFCKQLNVCQAAAQVSA